MTRGWCPILLRKERRRIKLRKVAVVTPGSFVIPSGRSSSVERVVEQTVPLVQKTMEIRVYGVIGNGLPGVGDINGVACYRLPKSAYYPALRQRLSHWNPDVVEIHNRPLLAKRLKLHFPNVKTVLTLHSNTFISPPYMNKQQFGKIAEMMDGLIVNSRFLSDHITFYHPSIKSKITVNHLGASLEHFTPPFSPAAKALKEAKLKHYGWNGRRIVLYAGRLIPDKGVHYLIDAFPKVIEKHPDALLMIVGSSSYGNDRETPYIRKLKKMARPFQAWITFLPFVPYPGIAEWYGISEIVVVPSSPREAFGLVNVEAMAAGVPVIASRAGGIPEIVHDGVNGYLIPQEHFTSGLAERIHILLEDDELRTRIGMAGRETVRQQFRWAYTAERWAQLMQNI
ncbi:glycosyltransferase family 4 protein [Paenibacillus dakarensis]|uniref:glycosyltransferase family 4 protein n=1 Tax=Paenibacillus dakarensis TaxID=1527293 RepID=UPI000ADCE895|nr:glycosyltransferase family 4 protein [Paenibacillus dakarensis]